MNIIEHNWSWRHSLSARSATDAIVLHHAAAKTASADDIHRAHLQRDGGTWAGIGYHLYIRKDGSIHRGRPIWASGAHVLGHNYHTLGICCEGNYDEETVMPAAQLQSVREALRYLKGIYPNAAIKCHRDLQATACPGRFYPVGEVLHYNVPAPAPATPEPVKPAEREETMAETIYKDIQDVPDYWRDEVQQLLDMGAIDGGTDREQNATDVNLTATEAKLCAIFVRALNKQKEGTA